MEFESKGVKFASASEQWRRHDLIRAVKEDSNGTYIGVGKDELANLGVQSVSIDALAGGQDQSGAGAVGAVPSGDHFRARAKNI
jgi:hypothetical protein